MKAQMMIANKACFARPATFNRSAAAPIASPLRAVPGASRRGTALLVRATPAPAPAAEPATQSATVQPQSDEDDSVFARKKWMKRGLPDTVAEALSSEDISRDLLAAVIINELATRNSRILKIEKDLKLAKSEMKAVIKDKQNQARVARLQAQIPAKPKELKAAAS